MLVGGTGCAAVRFEPPVGAPSARPDASSLWSQATEGCRDLEAFGGEVRASGRVDGQRIPGLRLGTAFTARGQVAIEARVSATAVFSLRGSADAATLVLPQDQQAVVGRTDDLLDALVGLRVGPERLLLLLSGCVSTGPATAGEAIGGVVRIRTPDAVVYLTEHHGRWRVRAGAFDGLDVAYEVSDGHWPRRLRLSSRPGQVPAIDLGLELVAATTDARPASVFVASVPAGFDRVTVAWLRENGPLRRPNP